MTGKVFRVSQVLKRSLNIHPEPHHGIAITLTSNKDPVVKQKAHELCSTLLGPEWSDASKIQGFFFTQRNLPNPFQSIQSMVE